MMDRAEAITYIDCILPYAKSGEEYESLNAALSALREQEQLQNRFCLQCGCKGRGPKVPCSECQNNSQKGDTRPMGKIHFDVDFAVDLSSEVYKKAKQLAAKKYKCGTSWERELGTTLVIEDGLNAILMSLLEKYLAEKECEC